MWRSGFVIMFLETGDKIPGSSPATPVKGTGHDKKQRKGINTVWSHCEAKQLNTLIDVPRLPQVHLQGPAVGLKFK